jgi:hypothetical protein
LPDRATAFRCHLEGEMECRQILAGMILSIGELRHAEVVGSDLFALVDAGIEIDEVPAGLPGRLVRSGKADWRQPQKRPDNDAALRHDFARQRTIKYRENSESLELTPMIDNSRLTGAGLTSRSRRRSGLAVLRLNAPTLKDRNLAASPIGVERNGRHYG